jgi:hypothetical protein
MINRTRLVWMNSKLTSLHMPSIEIEILTKKVLGLCCQKMVRGYM